MDEKQLTAWRLFITTHARIITQIDKALSDSGKIPLNWYDVLIELYEAPERKLRMSDLAERVLLTRSGLTRLVDRLEKEGYLKRELDAEDRRGFYAIITNAGIAAMRDAWPVYRNSIQSLFVGHLRQEEIDLLINIFTRMDK